MSPRRDDATALTEEAQGALTVLITPEVGQHQRHVVPPQDGEQWRLLPWDCGQWDTICTYSNPAGDGREPGCWQCRSGGSTSTRATAAGIVRA